MNVPALDSEKMAKVEQLLLVLSALSETVSKSASALGAKISTLTDEDRSRIRRAIDQVNSAGFDDWGAHAETLDKLMPPLKWLYTDYFRVGTSGIENVPQGRVILAANHGGQFPIDGLLIGLSMLVERDPPRLVRAMVERWVPSLPFIGPLFTRMGQVTGDTKNCRDLLDKDQCVLVFPEGVRGSGKTVFQRYQLQQFSTGFARMAVETRTPIVPVAVIGCEEIYPSLANIKPLAKLFKMPYVPLTPLGLLPLPCRVSLRFGEPILPQLEPGAPESEVRRLAAKIRHVIHAEIQDGLKKRDEYLFTGDAT